MIEASETQRIIFGCGNFGGLGSSPSLRDKGDAPGRGLALLDLAAGLGLRRFDTANTYGGGVSERVLGDWLRARGPAFRQSVEITSKVGNPHGCPPGERPLSRAQVAHHLDESLRRLGVERIDLYYMHEMDAATPMAETLEAFDRALAAGKIARFGISNAGAADIRSVLDLTGGRLREAFAHVQNGFNLLEQNDLAEVIPLAACAGLRYTAFSPLAGGLLSGKYVEGRAPSPGTRAGDAPQMYSPLLTPDNFARIEALKARATERGWTPAGAALRFILDTPGVDSLIIAPRSPEQLAAYAIAGRA